MSEEKYPHYFRSVAHLEKIDVYRVIDLFGVTDPCLQHALKKVMAAGQRGAKNARKDISEAIDSLSRKLEMIGEDEGAA